MTDRERLLEEARNAFDALAHSAQADGSIERATALWAISMGRELLRQFEGNGNE